MYRYGWRKAQHKLPHKMTRTTDNSTTAKMLTDFMLSANNTTPNTLPCTLLPPSVHRPTLAELLHLLIGTNPNSLPKSCWREHSPISPDSFPKTISFRTHDIPPPPPAPGIESGNLKTGTRLVAWYSGRTLVFDRRTFPVPRSTCI